MKILFLYHPYINAGFTRAICEASDEVFFCSTQPEIEPSSKRQDMTWGTFFKLRRRIRAKEFDLIIAYAPEEALWRPHRAFVKNLPHAIKKLLFYFPDFATKLLLPAIRQSGTKLVFYDYDDLTIIPSFRNEFLDACHLYFKRHPAINVYKSFLFQTKRDGNLWNVLRNNKYRGYAAKIRPIGYGTDYKDYFAECLAPEKKYDVFFTGALQYSPVRQDGSALIERMKAEGLRVCQPSKVPHQEFLRLCSESWLVLSPEGAEWHSARHYEALLMKSVPLINYPNVRLHRPLLDGVHCIYYPPEGDYLAGKIREALADKERLQRIAAAGHDYVLEHHINTQVVKWMIDQAMSGVEDRN